MELMPDLETLIRAIGLLGVWAMVYTESGLLVGLFLPGDSLLFTAGFLASQGYLDIALLSAGSFVAAVLGDSTGYAFGYRVGRRLFQREDSFLFHKEHLVRAERFYQRHGKKTIILARFIPIVRTFAPVVAGMGRMEYRSFLVYNIIGGALWAIGIPVAGYLLGSLVPDIDTYLLPVVAVIIVASVAPGIIHIVRELRGQQRTAGKQPYPGNPMAETPHVPGVARRPD